MKFIAYSASCSVTFLTANYLKIIRSSEARPHLGTTLQGQSASHLGNAAAAHHTKGHIHQLHEAVPSAGRRGRYHGN